MATATSRLSCDTCPVRERAACAALTGDERDELARIGRGRTLRAGETLFAAGDNSCTCATLVSGALKIASHSADGTERILGLVHPAGFVGEMFAPIAHHDVVALTDSRVCLFDRDDYVRAVERFPALAGALLRRSAAEVLETRALVDLQSRRDARARLAGLLLALGKAASHSPCHAAERFALPLRRGEIAALLGLTLETVSRQFGRLERDGLIEREGSRGIWLRDPGGLERLAG